MINPKNALEFGDRRFSGNESPRWVAIFANAEHHVYFYPPIERAQRNSNYDPTSVSQAIR
jgi:hypothetical protein